MAQAFAVLREQAGHGETDAFPASEFALDRRYDHVVALSRSGTTTEIVRLLESVTACPSTLITTSPERPAAQRAGSVVSLGFADEESVVQTRFATTALALWRAFLGADLSAAIEDARGEVAAPLDGQWLTRRQFSFLGTGWTVGLANEAALKLRESAQAWTESYPAMEFRHGPISVIDNRSLVWIFGAAPHGLVDELGGTGTIVVQSTLDPMAHLVGAQRLAVALATRAGLDPDAPRNLTRAIVLTSQE
jgi:fructoselysine-6-P-deglycase FrlB-like protein